MIDQMKSLISLIQGLSIQFEAAQGNDQLLANLECARENAQKSANSQLMAVEPVIIILELVAPILEIAQVGPIEVPTLGGVEGVEEMQQFVSGLEGFVDTLQLVADAAGGCN